MPSSSRRTRKIIPGQPRGGSNNPKTTPIFRSIQEMKSPNLLTIKNNDITLEERSLKELSPKQIESIKKVQSNCYWSISVNGDKEDASDFNFMQLKWMKIFKIVNFRT